jgi:hypothetical protein
MKQRKNLGVDKVLDENSDSELDEQTEKKIDEMLEARSKKEKKEMRAKSILMRHKGVNIQVDLKNSVHKSSAKVSANSLQAKRTANETFHKLKSQTNDYWSSLDHYADNNVTLNPKIVQKLHNS